MEKLEVLDISNNSSSEEEEKNTETAKISLEESKIQSLRENILLKEYLIKISLFQHDIEGFFNPPPFYIKINRSAYLWSLLPQIKEFFDYYAQNTTKHENWFEMNNQPLNWDYPFGIILDLFVPLQNQDDKYFGIVFHYRNYPAKVLGSLPSILKLKESIIHSLKDAAWARSGKSDCVKNQLNGRDVDFIWNNITEQKIIEVFNITSKLKTTFKSGKIPCRFFVKKSENAICKNIDAELTLMEIAKNVFPNAFESDGTFKKIYEKFSFYNSGIILPMEIKLKDIDSVFHYVDFYNYFFIDY
jgi:hypothetical protein